MNDSIHVLLLSGSIRVPSYTRTLTEHIEKALVYLGIKATHWNFRDKCLPIAEPKFHKNPLMHDDKAVRDFAKIADECDAFVLSSPIYHNSFSGVLKNALDHLTISQFYYKPVGLISHGGYRSTQAVDQLRVVVRGLLGVATPTQICTAKQDYLELEGEGYEPKSADILERINQFTNELVVFANIFRQIRQGAN